MSKTIPLTFNVFKDCGTCEHVCFLETTLDNEPEVAKCSLSDEIITDDATTSDTIVYKNIDCDKWKFDKTLLDDTGHFIDLETSPLDAKE